MSDPYVYPRSQVLKNRFDLTDQAALDRAEADAVAMRSVLLQANPLKGNFDSQHLKRIHQYLFQDVYDWAGQVRTIPMAKADYIGTSQVTRFVPPDLIDEQLRELFEGLALDGFLKGLQRRDFAEKIAVLFAEINRIHPFREGNGRAQRQFVRQLSTGVGYRLHFEVVSRERLVKASILSANGDVAMMVRLMDEITDIERIQPLAKVIEHLEQHNFHWNDIYISTTTSGQQCIVIYAGADGSNFFFRTEQDEIFVGRLTDLEQVPNPGDTIRFMAR